MPSFEQVIGKTADMGPQHATAAELEAQLAHIRRAPTDGGTVELIARRQAVDERELLEAAELDETEGLVGDTWLTRGSRSTPDGGPDPRAQLTLMNARVAEAVARTRERWALAGDQLYVDLDLSATNLPPGTRLAIGSAEIEVSDKPHNGCAKFRARYGEDALRFVNSEVGKALHLRGINATVVRSGRVHAGDDIRKL